MREIDAADLQEMMSERSLLDVRTPAEFAQGHVPGAANLPLFTDEQRAEVGTLYKQVSREAAFRKGLDFAGERLRWYVEEAERLAPGRKVALHCWRGGQRSRSMAWLLETAGFDLVVLNGGYKAYRRFQRDYYQEQTRPFVLLGGSTGSGKTEVLHALRELGEQVIDLEGLARHKGSAFGGFGQPCQPTQQQFENDLFEAFRRQDPGRRVWLENESRSIGRVGFPDEFWVHMTGRPILELDIPFEERIRRLVLEYGRFDPQALKSTFQQIRKRLGGQNVILAEEAIDRGDLAEAARVALRYYDKAYHRSTASMLFSEQLLLKTSTADVRSTAKELLKMADQHGI